MKIMESQSSSSSSSKGQEQDKKKLKPSDGMSTDGGVEGQVKIEVKQTCFDDLPPEMLQEILKKLDVSSLLSCRLVNRRFNEMSCELLLKSQARIEVEHNWNNNHKFFIRRNSKSLSEFIDCFKKSKNFPCARYGFQPICDPVKHEVFQKFISSCQNSIKSFDLDLSKMYSLQNLIASFDYIGNSLLYNLPNLEEFGLRLDPYSLASQHNLSERSTDSLKSFQLAKLKVVRLSPLLLQKFPGFVKDLLEAAVNLKKIDRCNFDTSLKFDDFKLLYSLGKLDLLQEAAIPLSVELFSWIKTSMEQGNPVIFKLTKLELLTLRISKEPSILPEATIFMTHLFESVKDTLTELKSDDLAFLNNLRLPKFTKLRKLYNFVTIGVLLTRTIKFLKVETLQALQEIHLIGDVRMDFPVEGPISVMPNIKIVRVSRFQVNTTDSVQQLAIRCPNLIELQIYETLMNFPLVGPSIWTHMTKLQSLSLSINGDSDSGENSVASIVSTFTGISKENCQLLLDQFKKINEKPMPKSKKLQAKQSLKLSESKMQKMRENASILDLKDLRSLYLGIWMAQGISESDKSSFFDVSKLCAFDLMPRTNVSTRFH